MSADTKSGEFTPDQAAACYARHDAAMRAKHKMTPYRKGIADGRAYGEIFGTWSAAAQVSRNYDGRPSQPECPYTVKRSASAWIDGFRRDMDAMAKLTRAAILKATGGGQ